jgi:tetratricopeptide (TPR) repeat protein
MPIAENPALQEVDTSSWSGRHAAIAGLILFFAAVVTYIPAMSAGFVWDDELEVVGNQVLQSPDQLAELWLRGDTADYYPLKSTVQWVGWRLWGANPTGYHLVNIGLHGLGAVLLWRWLRRIRVPGAWLAGLVFAVHPVAVESVAWISELKNTLSLVFFLLTLLAFARYESRPSARGYGAALLAYGAALLSKTSVVPLPLVLLVAAYWQRGAITRRDIRRAIPFFCLAAGFALLTVVLQYHRAIGPDLISSTPPGGWASRLSTAGLALGFYLFHAVAPVGLIMIYPQWHLRSPVPWNYVPWLGFAAIFAICWQNRRILGRGPICALAYFVAMLLPVLGFFKMSYMWHSLVADHFEYLAIIGIIALESGVVATWAGFKPSLRPVLAGLAALVVLLFAAMSWRHEETFSDEEVLWNDTLAANPNAWAAHDRLGALLLSKGRDAEALLHFGLAVQDEPTQAMARANYGYALNRLGRQNEAIEQYQIGLRLENTPLLHTVLALAYANTDRYDESIGECRKALQIDPSDPQAYCALGYAFQRKGDLNAAKENLNRALALQPDLQEGRILLARIDMDLKRNDEALAQLREVTRNQPKAAWAHAMMGSLLLDKGRPDEAILHLRRALEINPGDGEASGLLNKAIEARRKAGGP